VLDSSPEPTYQDAVLSLFNPQKGLMFSVTMHSGGGGYTVVTAAVN
jgi:hypothetical protein